MHFCCLSHPVSSILGQLQQTNIPPFAEPQRQHHWHRAGTQKTSGKSEPGQRQGFGALKTTAPDKACAGRLGLSVHQWVSFTVKFRTTMKSCKTASPVVPMAARMRLGRTDSTVHSWQNEILVKLRVFLQSQRASTDQEGSLLQHLKPPNSTSPH